MAMVPTDEIAMDLSTLKTASKKRIIGRKRAAWNVAYHSIVKFFL